MLTSKDIAWIAGLLEGEGSFLVANKSICVMCQMTDKDIIERLASYFVCPVGGPDKDGRNNGIRKQAWRIRFYGSRAASWMMTLYPLMGERRKKQIEKCLDFWKLQNSYSVSHKWRNK